MQIDDSHNSHFISMAHIFEVKALRSIDSTATKWKITSSEYIDVDLYMIINQKIKSFDLVATSVSEEEVFIYEIVFHRSYEVITMKRMFPGCKIEPIRQRAPARIYVTYCRETNSYIPLDDPSMQTVSNM